MNNKVSIDEVIAWHQGGHLFEAKQGYLALLEINPQNVTVLHLLGLLNAEEGNLNNALQLLRKALSISPHDHGISLHLANVLKAQGAYQEAIQILESVIVNHPEFAAPYNNLGTIYYIQENYQEALKVFQKAIDLKPNYVDAYYNLGLTLSKLNQHNQAINSYQNLLEIAPQHVFGQFQLACLLMKTNQYASAINHFLMIEQTHQFHLETQINLANCFLNLGQLEDAKVHYLRAIEIDSNDKQLFFNLGVLHAQQNKMQAAIDNYLQALRLDQNYYPAHNNLAVAYLAVKNIPAALQHFNEVLRIQPDNRSVQHSIQVLLQDKTITNSPQEYIQSLFNNYAGHYDQHLQQLNYQIPELFQNVFNNIKPGKGKWDILDLGCGTGLCGQQFKQKAHSLIGVDLSSQMLTIAAKKNLYDQLIETDILSFMKETSATFDLILAGDIFVYFGALEELFSAMQRILRPDGIIIFNTEIIEQSDYELLQSGRFGHHQNYLDQLARQYQFRILHKQVVTLRTQNQDRVPGYLYVLQAHSL